METSTAERLAEYPFATDVEFQQGLAGILGNGGLEGKSDAEKAELVLRSQVFYFNRISGASLSLEEARDALRNHSASPVAPTSSSNDGQAEEPRVLTFAELKALIEQGKTDQIPNNKVIPEELSKDVPSESTAPVRRKPWEISPAPA